MDTLVNIYHTFKHSDSAIVSYFYYMAMMIGTVQFLMFTYYAA